MAILPIDIQTIIAQLNQVGRAQQNIQNAPIAQQQHYGNIIQQQTLLKDNQVNQLQQTDNQDKKVNPDTKRRFQEKSETKERKKEKQEKIPLEKHDLFKDPDKGNFIDVKK